MNKGPRFLLTISSLLAVLVASHVTEGTKPTFTTPVLTPGVSHRQDFCGQYQLFQNGSLALRDGLRGLVLHPIIGPGRTYFRYTEAHGIDESYPGILIELLDELADRAGFEWRDSFAVLDPPTGNTTYTELLKWGSETYDLAVNWWDRTNERLDIGISYLEPWNDASVILIDKDESAFESSTEVVYWNWLRPFETKVWWLIVSTIVLSGLVYQFIEYLQDEREGRSAWDWTTENLYMSAINFSQNFEYAPTSFGSKVFGVSMTLFALLITATYTANLASLLVESKRQPPVVDSIERAVLMELPICTYANTPFDQHIQKQYPNARRRPKKTELEAFQALQNGECALFTAHMDNWLIYKGDNRYNPECDMKWVGRVQETIKSGFAIKSDAGFKCTSFIRDVLNLHMVEMIREGVLEELKDKQRQEIQAPHPLTCEAPITTQEEDNGRRVLRQGSGNRMDGASAGVTRQLKSGGSAAAISSGGSDDPTSLTLEQMAGTFVLHWFLMAVAVLISACTVWYEKLRGSTKEPSETADVEQDYVCSWCQAAGNGTERSIPFGVFDWEGEYMQLSADEKALVDIIFKRKQSLQRNLKDMEYTPQGSSRVLHS